MKVAEVHVDTYPDLDQKKIGGDQTHINDLAH